MFGSNGFGELCSVAISPEEEGNLGSVKGNLEQQNFSKHGKKY